MAHSVKNGRGFPCLGKAFWFSVNVDVAVAATDDLIAVLELVKEEFIEETKRFG
jgi:hypothetical protein